MNYYISDLHLFCCSQIDNGGRDYDGRPYQSLEEMHMDYEPRSLKEILEWGESE